MNCRYGGNVLPSGPSVLTAVVARLLQHPLARAESTVADGPREIGTNREKAANSEESVIGTGDDKHAAPAAGVGILTIDCDFRHDRDANPAVSRIRVELRIFALAVLGLAGIAVAYTAEAADWQDTGEIAKVAERYIENRLGGAPEGIESRAEPLDPRLRLPRCDGPLIPFVRGAVDMRRRSTVGVRCDGTKPWKVYVPVRNAILQPVVVAGRSLPKGHLLIDDDVRLARFDVSGLSAGYLSAADELTGQRLKRAVTTGQIVTPSMLAAETVIRRGQSVILLVKINNINIRMAGTALSDGARNQRIRVRNDSSGRIVEGMVRSGESIEVMAR